MRARGLFVAVMLWVACAGEDPPARDGAADGPLDGGSSDAIAAAADGGDGRADAGQLGGDGGGGADAAPDGDAGPGPSAGPGWRRLFTPGVPSVEHLAVAPDGTIYAAQGKHSGILDVYERDRQSAGVYRSTDLGATWEAASRGLGDYGINSLNAGGSLLLAGNVTAYGSRDGGRNWQRLSWLRSPEGQVAADGDVVVAASGGGVTEVIRSTDGGKSFVPVTFHQSPGRVSAVGVRGQVVLIGSWNGLQRSSDAGVTFAPVAVTQSLPFAQVPVVSRIVLASGGLTFAVGAGALIRSTDGGITWAAGGLPVAQINVRDVAVADGQVLVAGVTTSLPERATAWRSADGGVTWTSSTLLDTRSANAAAIVPGRLLVGTDRGLQVSDDAGQTWRWGNGPARGPIATSMTRGLAGFTIDRSPAALSATGDLYIHDGEALWRSTDGAADWVKLPLPDPPTRTPGLHVTASGALLCNGSRSVDHGMTWTAMEGLAGAGGARLFASAGPTVYALANRLWRSDDDGVRWTELVTSIYGGASLGVTSDGVVIHHNRLSRDRGATWQETRRLVSYVDGRDRLYEFGMHWLSCSQDQGMTFRGLDGTPPIVGFPSAIMRIVVDPADRIWAHVDQRPAQQDDADGDRVHVATFPAAGQATWSRADEGLNQGAVSGFEIDRQGRVHAATNGGLYVYVP